MIRLGIAALALAAIARGAPVPEPSPTLAERQFTIGNPWTGIWPPGPPETPIIVFPGDGRGDVAPSTKRRDIDLGGSGSSELKARLTALQHEYEALVQRYGSSPPSHVAQRLEAIAAELKKYGITIVKSPDGTTTVITPDKARRAIGEGSHADPSLDLVGLETTLEQLMQQYGPNPPHDVYIIEEKMKSILVAYGITTIKSPDDTTTTIAPSAKRATAGYELVIPVPSGTTVPGNSISGSPPLVPGETIPGGPMMPSTKTRKRQEATTTTTTTSAAGLEAALARLGEPYGGPGADTAPQDQGLAAPGWPPVLGDGSTVIGPSD